MLIRSGISEEDAKDYIVAGCWGINENCCGTQDGAYYTNLLKVFEYQIHNRTDMMEKVGMHFDSIDNAENFEEVYGQIAQFIVQKGKEEDLVFKYAL